MNQPHCLLFQVLGQPQKLAGLSLAQWDVLIPQARHAILLGHLASLVEELNIRDRVPDQVMRHMHSARVIADKQFHSVRWELDKLKTAFQQLGLPVILLKGAAYALSGLPVSRGRLFSDIDLLVDKEQLTRVERMLSLHSWMPGDLDEYDQRYYRQWMHEIPPLKHLQRKSVLDVHHTILPPTAQYHPDPAKLRAAARDLEPGVKMLCPEDMVIHSATHLFHEGELEHGLRDLVDIQGLVTCFAQQDADFWNRLVPRAIELDLLRPLYYGLYYAQQLLNTPVPAEVMKQASQAQPNALMLPIMNSLFKHAFAPDHPSCDQPLTGISRWLLYVRAHYLRMPLHLLLPHLLRKAWHSRMEKPLQPVITIDGVTLPKPKPSRWRFRAQ